LIILSQNWVYLSEIPNKIIRSQDRSKTRNHFYKILIKTIKLHESIIVRMQICMEGLS